MSDNDPCAFCRVGPCAIHGTFRMRLDKRRVPAESEFLPIGCCDSLESAVFLGIVRKDVERSGGLAIVNRHGAMGIRYCPWCSAVLRD